MIDQLPPEQRERVFEIAKFLDRSGLPEVKVITVLIAGRLLSLTPAWLNRQKTPVALDLALCIEWGLLSLAYIANGEAFFIGGENIAPEVNANPDAIFNIAATLDADFIHAPPPDWS
jgi:hypothetical protein